MADIVGSITPEVDLREAPAWTEPSRIIVLFDASGRRHGRVEWLASEMGEEFDKALLALYAAATRTARATAPGVASSLG